MGVFFSTTICEVNKPVIFFYFMGSLSIVEQNNVEKRNKEKNYARMKLKTGCKSIIAKYWRAHKWICEERLRLKHRCLHAWQNESLNWIFIGYLRVKIMMRHKLVIKWNVKHKKKTSVAIGEIVLPIKVHSIDLWIAVKDWSCLIDMFWCNQKRKLRTFPSSEFQWMIIDR